MFRVQSTKFYVLPTEIWQGAEQKLALYLVMYMKFCVQFGNKFVLVNFSKCLNLNRPTAACSCNFDDFWKIIRANYYSCLQATSLGIGSVFCVAHKHLIRKFCIFQNVTERINTQLLKAFQDSNAFENFSTFVFLRAWMCVSTENNFSIQIRKLSNIFWQFSSDIGAIFFSSILVMSVQIYLIYTKRFNSSCMK